MSSGLKVEGVIWAKAGGPVSSESIPAGRAQRQGGGEAWKPAGLGRGEGKGDTETGDSQKARKMLF